MDGSDSGVRQNLVASPPHEVTFEVIFGGHFCSVVVKPELRKWTTRPKQLSPLAEEFLKGLQGVGDFYVSKTEGQSSRSSVVSWLSKALSQGAHHMKTTVKGRKSNKTKRLRLQLSYARVAAEEGVDAMEGRCIDLKLGRCDSRNKSKGLASAGDMGYCGHPAW